ncbi:hypothetical protein ACFFWD_07520 [Bradyrhizobium erythrophlei]|uniref:hypothetical protein n=1 Tax=Bradyrhizobium erythrophlei TaxID=1437360 RepID=UPI0035F08B37
MMELDQAAASELPPTLPPILHRSSRRVLWVLVFMVLLLSMSAAGAYFWTNVGEFAGTSAAREVPPMLSLSGEDRAALSEILSGQQKASDEIAELNRSIDAQRADLRRISDQITALTLRIDSLQNPTPSASSSPVSSSPPAQAVSNPAKKLMRPSRPQGPVSVGGAPLISAPKTDEP